MSCVKNEQLGDLLNLLDELVFIMFLSFSFFLSFIMFFWLEKKHCFVHDVIYLAIRNL